MTMTPAERLSLADDMSRHHRDYCKRCGLPDATLPTAACRQGRALEHAWLGAWRRAIDALSDGRMQ